MPFDRRVFCGFCGTLALVIFINATPICEKCHTEDHHHLPESHHSSPSMRTLSFYSISGWSDTSFASTYPVFSDSGNV